MTKRSKYCCTWNPEGLALMKAVIDMARPSTAKEEQRLLKFSQALDAINNGADPSTALDLLRRRAGRPAKSGAESTAEFERVALVVDFQTEGLCKDDAIALAAQEIPGAAVETIRRHHYKKHAEMARILAHPNRKYRGNRQLLP